MKIYKRYEALSPIYQGGLTNHLPMVYTALKQLGLSNEEIIVKLDKYKDQKGILDLTEITTPISEFEQEYINLTSKHLGEINHKGVDVVLGEFINQFKYNIESALYHGLIRLAYAKQENNPLMIAQAMAYFELSSECIELSKTNIIKSKNFDEYNDMYLEKFMMIDFQFNAQRTMEKYRELLNQEIVKESLVRLSDISKEKVLSTILNKYAKTECFYNLHVITGFEALLELEEYIFDFDKVLNHFFLTAQVFMLFTMEEKDEKVIKNLGFKELTKQVINLDDAHKIKLFYSLKKLDRQFDNIQILQIANSIM